MIPWWWIPLGIYCGAIVVHFVIRFAVWPGIKEVLKALNMWSGD